MVFISHVLSITVFCDDRHLIEPSFSVGGIPILEGVNTREFPLLTYPHAAARQRAHCQVGEEIAQIKEANRLYLHGGKKKPPGTAGDHARSASKIAGNLTRVGGAHRLEKAVRISKLSTLSNTEQTRNQPTCKFSA
jgi:hypothetical protein